MCLILLSFKMHPRYPFVFAANRDEFYARPSAPASFWDEAPHVLAGRDLQERGTWMGITRKGRFAAVTNYRDPASHKEGAPSRGWLVRDFLLGNEDAEAYLSRVAERASHYNGFSLIVGDMKRLFYFSNRGNMMRELGPGVYGLSNRLLDTPWPKVVRGKHALESLLTKSGGLNVEDVLEILMDRWKPDDDQLPDTGVGLAWERILAPIFIESRVYGTRSSTVLIREQNGHILFVERIFDGNPEPWMTTRFEFRIQD